MLFDPGWLYVLAATLPLLAGLTLAVLRRRAERWAGWLVVGCLSLSTILSLVGAILFQLSAQAARDQLQAFEPWSASIPWLHLTFTRFDGNGGFHYDAPGVELYLGYLIDTLTTVLFLIITIVALALGLYVQRAVPSKDSIPFNQRSSHFFTLYSILIALLLYLILANNLPQLFVCWTLLSLVVLFFNGISQPASSFKMFLMHRAGDAGFLLAMAILWTFTGTLSLVTVREEVRDVLGNVMLEDGLPKKRIDQLSVVDALLTPNKDSRDEPFNEKDAQAKQLCRVNPTGRKKLELAESGAAVVIWAQDTLNNQFLKPVDHQFNAYNPSNKSGLNQGLRTMPYWALTLMGLGFFLSIVSLMSLAPLQTWLPDLMSNACLLIASISYLALATAALYLLFRIYPILTLEVQWVMAASGIFTAIYALSCAIASTSSPRAKAYVTMSLLASMITWPLLGTWSLVPVLLSLAIGSVLLRHRAQTARHDMANFLETGWYWDTMLHRCCVVPALQLGHWLDRLDRQFWNRLVTLIAKLTHFVARVEHQFDETLVDGLTLRMKRTRTLKIDFVLLALLATIIAAIVVAIVH